MSESTSRRSDDVSETSSQAADRAILKRRKHNRDEVQSSEEDDLLEQRKSLQEGVFAAMYMLSRSASTDSWRFATVKVVLEALIPFLILFNPTNGWVIATSNPVWQVVRWTLPRSPVARIWGYDVYIRIFYMIVAMVYIAVGCIAALTIAMRKQEHSRALKRFAKFLQLFTEVVFALAYMSVFDYMVFLFDCRFATHGPHMHSYFTDVECFQTPHLIHMCVAGVTAIVFFCSTTLMLVAGCDLSPVARGIMASPTAVTRLKVLALKALYVMVMDTLSSIPKAQGVAVLVLATAITYFNFTRLPFVRYYINFFWVGGWTAVSYACGVFCYLSFQKNTQHDMTKIVLYGVFPAAVMGMATTAAWFWYRMQPARKFVNLNPAIKLKKVHQFTSPADVEVVARTMRKFDTDGIISEERSYVGETIIKCGMVVFPNNVELLILYANYLMEVKKDGPASRTQLQLALKGGPSLVQRYQIFSTIENSKRLKDGQEGQLDLQSYVEFKRNYRAVIRVHKAALASQREFWQLMQRESVRMSAVEAHLREMDEAADTAHQVYKRVLERYPNNGKLLRCYGKFLEDVRNDLMAASKVYTEAARNGGADGLLSLDLQVTGSEKPEFLTSMDLHEDACVVINAEGTILMVNTCITALLGYPKAELEGANVSVIMPQPFSGRHPSYLSRYVQGGEPHILDTVRDVLALHKERHVFPIQICVTKLSGVGTDAIFLGLLRPQPPDSRNMRAWVAPNGVILCTDPQFASLTGMLGEEMVGCNIQTLCTDMAAVEALLELCKEAPYEALLTGRITRNVFLLHKHLPPVPVDITVTPGGTDAQRIFVFNARRTDGHTDGLMVVDCKGSLSFATWDVAAMLGYPLQNFLRLRLEQLMPLPFATMHNKYLRDQTVIVPPTSCRAGRVVQLVNSNGVNVPVRLQVSTQDDPLNGQTKHIVQVRKMDVSSNSIYADCRLVFLCTANGQILSVDHPNSTLFGFTASACVGSNLADCIDVFGEWRAKAGAHQLELLILSLLDREMEMSGTSWRVRVHCPVNKDSMLPNIDPRATPRGGGAARQGRSACMQTELVDSSEHADLSADLTRSLTKIVLWRRDLLTGVVELDPNLVIRRADVHTGLILGLPPSALLRTPLHRILDIPRGVTWDELMKDKKKKSSMKSGAGAVVSTQHSFEGPHPDGGTMKIFIQGVSGGGSSRIHVTLHPDTSYQGARANIYRALGLEALIQSRSVKRREPTATSSGTESKGAVAGAATTAPTATIAAPATIPAAAAAAAEAGGSGAVPSRRDRPKAARSSTRRSRAERDIRNIASLRSSGGGDDEAAAATATALAPAAPTTALAPTAGAPAASAAIRQPSKSLALALLNGAVEASNSQDGGYPLQQQQQQQQEESSSDDNSTTAAKHTGYDNDDGEWPDGCRASCDERRSDKSASISADGVGGNDAGKCSRGGKTSKRRHRYEDDGDKDDDDDADSEGDEDNSGGGGEDDDDDDNGDPGHLHKTAHSQSEFVAQWVRTLARQMTGQIQSTADPAADRDSIPPSRQEAQRKSSGLNGQRPLLTATGTVAATATAIKAITQRHTTDSWPKSDGYFPAGSSVDGIGAGGGMDGVPLGGGAGGGGGLSVSSRGGGGGGGTSLPVSSHGGMHWALLERGPTMMRGSRRKLDLEPVYEERSDWQTAAGSIHGGGGSGGGGGRRTRSRGDGGGGIVNNFYMDQGNGRFDGSGAGDGAGAAVIKVSELEAEGQAMDDRKSSDGASSMGDDDDATSQGLSSAGGGVEGGRDGRDGVFTDTSSAVDVDLVADARRTRLLKRLFKLYSGPQLTVPLLRMRYHTWLLLGAMLLTHVVMYVIFINIINRQFANVREVHRLALAADRCQLATVKVALSEFCTRPGVEPVAICEVSLNTTLADLRASLDDLEVYHQTTYLGSETTPRKIKEPTAYFLWTSNTAMYKAYFDIQPAVWVNETAGVWQMGNRFIATARELLYWGEKLHGRIANLRAYKFVLANGPWAVFTGYTDSLDYLVNYAWEEVSQVQKALIIILAIEAAGVQLACILYELVLLRTVERIRSGGLLTSLAIPGAMLRVLANRPIVIMEDSDNEDGEDDAPAADGAGAGGGGGGGGRAANNTDTHESEDEELFFGNRSIRSGGGGGGGGGDSGGDGDNGNTTRRYRRMSMDIPVPPPGVLLPPYDGAASPSYSIPTTPNQTHMMDSNSMRPRVSGGIGFGAGGPAVHRHFSTGIVKSSRSGRLRVNGKELIPSYLNTFKFMTPLLLWEIALVALGAVSYMQLQGMQGPLASLNMASHVIYRYTRVRIVALLLVSSEPYTADKAFYRGVLRTELTNLQSDYDTLMYGGLSITQVGKVFQKPVPASSFESSSFSNNFFKQQRCFRWDQSKCYTRDSPYYEVTHHGLDAMFRRIVSEMALLASDDDADAVYNGTRYTTMYMVGTKDLYEGLQSSAQLFVDFSISRYNAIKMLQTILLAVTIGFFLSYALLLLRPYTVSVEREAQRLAGLMSQVPAEMDVTAHVRHVLREHVRHIRNRTKSRRGSMDGAVMAGGGV